VAQAVADRRAELARVQGFFADNAALVSLVQRLPDELSHEIMVPSSSPSRLLSLFSIVLTDSRANLVIPWSGFAGPLWRRRIFPRQFDPHESTPGMASYIFFVLLCWDCNVKV
jgi:hypothetical protein